MATIIDFLNKLINYGEHTKGELTEGIVQPYFRKSLIKNIDKTCCTKSEVEVYDFDECKTILTRKKDMQLPKSCDALKIEAEQEKIYFIEFKRWQTFIERQLITANKPLEKVETQIEKFDILTKLSDSLFLLNTIIQESNFKITVEEKKNYLATPKQMILLVDIHLANPIQKIAATLSALASTSSSPDVLIQQSLEEKINSIPMEGLSNVQPILLKDCNSIDDFFTK